MPFAFPTLITLIAPMARLTASATTDHDTTTLSRLRPLRGPPDRLWATIRDEMSRDVVVRLARRHHCTHADKWLEPEIKTNFDLERGAHLAELARLTPTEKRRKNVSLEDAKLRGRVDLESSSASL